MELKDVLGEIEADGAHLVHGRLLEWALTPPLWHVEAVGGVHTIRARTSRVERPKRSSLTTTSSSPACRKSMIRASSSRPSRLLPLAFSVRTTLHPFLPKPCFLQGAVLVGGRDAGVAVASHGGAIL